MQIFCDRLKEARLAKALRQRDMADVMGIINRAYQHYEEGSREPNLEKLKLICKLLEVSADWLLGLSDSKERR